MPRTRDVPLTRDLIVEAALRISLRDADGGAAPTGGTIGQELGVDRSAIWRHFRDRDELLMATTDAMFAVVRQGVDASRPPRERLKWIWDSTITAFLERPRIGELVGARFHSGPNVLALVTEVLGALRALGLSEEDAVTEYRAFIDMNLAYAAMVAQSSLVSPEREAEDEMRMLAAIRALPADERPVALSLTEELVEVSPRTAEVVFATYFAGLEARYPVSS